MQMTAGAIRTFRRGSVQEHSSASLHCSTTSLSHWSVCRADRNHGAYMCVEDCTRIIDVNKTFSAVMEL